jgi:hypothetical protein
MRRTFGDSSMTPDIIIVDGIVRCQAQPEADIDITSLASDCVIVLHAFCQTPHSRSLYRSD